MRTHCFCHFGAAELDGQFKWGLTVVSSPIGIRSVGEKPLHSVDSNRGISQQHTFVKKRTAIPLAGYIHIDASLQSQLGKFNSNLSEIRFRQVGRRRDKAVFPLVRSLPNGRCKEPVLDRGETPSDFRRKRCIGPIKSG
jgi:hypothetical protein